MAKKKPLPTPDEGPDRPEPVPPKPKAKAKPKPGRAGKADGPSALERAEEIAARAAETVDPRRRVALAREAIEVSPDCSEAYLLLADHVRSRKESIAFYGLAVEAAARVIGPEAFRAWEGHFWGLLETRPYMRARLALAEAQWAVGRRPEAADHLAAMLRLNPGDNQGLRYILAGWLLDLDRLDELDELLVRFDEDSATWTYTRALVEFRRSGDSPAARKLLQAARRSNKHVPAFLTAVKPLPPDQPPFYSPGDEDEAVIYVGHNLGAWKASPGALTWVKSKIKPPKKKAQPKPEAAGPSPIAEARLLRLPSELDAWQVDFRQFPRRVEIAGERIRPWMVLVSSRTNDLVLAHALAEREPSAAMLWDVVAGAMERPAAGEPHRPTELQVRPDAVWEALEDPFEAIGVTYARTPVLDQIDALFDDLSRHMAGSEPPGLLDMPGVTPDRVGEFYEAAAGFFRRAPWRALGYEAVIRVECDRYESGPWFAVIMGQSGLTLGVALYEDLALLRKMWSGKLSDEQGARRTVALTVTFDDEASLSEVDLEAIAAHDWPIAAPEAYPSIFRKERGLSMRPPLGWEIDLMTACLRVLPDFVARRPTDDTTRELVPAPTASGPIELGLSWIEEVR